MDRRDFLKKGGALLAGGSGALALPVLTSCDTGSERTDSPLAGHKWGMVIDLNKCQSDCTACLDACRTENNVAYHNDKRWDIHWIRKASITPKDSEHAEDPGRPAGLHGGEPVLQHVQRPALRARATG